ncbi:MAG: response regulator [Myxococcota bacterium]
MKASVVYIDDEPAICRIVQWRLEGAGLSVKCFTEPEAAIEWIERHPVRCILCDQRMPSMSALELRGRLDPALPFWVVTGDLLLGPDATGRSDIRGVIHKPIDFDELVSLVGALD